jgi:hypothetical protein
MPILQEQLARSNKHITASDTAEPQLRRIHWNNAAEGRMTTAR